MTEVGGDAILTLASKTSGAAIESTVATLGVGEYAEARIEFAGSGADLQLARLVDLRAQLAGRRRE